MAVLKPRRTEKNAPRSPERPLPRVQRSTQEDVPIHTMQRPEMRQRPRDMRLRDLQRPPQQVERPMQRSRPSFRGIAIGIICILLSAALIYVLMSGDSSTVVEQTQPQQPTAPVTETELKQAASPESVEQVQAVLQGLAKHILLPSQAPQVMQIMNPDELIQKDPFFTGSESGDVLLIYKDAGKAIVYSPRRDIIVNVGPVQVEPPQAAPRTQ